MTDSFEAIRSQVVADLKRLGSTLRAGKRGAGDTGRILRAHLVVETCLRRHIQAVNPNLGSIEPLGLSFDKLRTVALGMKVYDVAWANDQLVALNKIRNKLAHRIDAKISEADIAPLRRDVDALLQDSQANSRWLEMGCSPASVAETWTIIFGMILALEEAMQTHGRDAEALPGELDAVAVQLYRELFDEDEPASGV